MTCAVCKQERLPHQCAHTPDGSLAVCFGAPPNEMPCGGSAHRAPWWLEKMDGEPAYTILARLVAERVP